MRILGFCKKWDKLGQPIFTTFRYPRRDKDWYVGEKVQVVLKPRSKERQVWGVAQITGKQERRLYKWTRCLNITDEEARADGFVNWGDMENWLKRTYGQVPTIMNKITLRWENERNR